MQWRKMVLHSHVQRVSGRYVLNFFQFPMQPIQRLLLLAVLVSAGFAATPKKATTHSLPSRTPPINIILITLDTTRADRMGFLGSKRGLTPNLDKLAEHSVVFTRAYAQVPLTTPSHAAMLTGTYPQFSHLADLGSPLGKDLPYVPDLFHHRGYQTAAFVGSSILDPAIAAPGFQRGFDIYDAKFHARAQGEDRYHSIERRAEEVANHALGWISQHQRKPFFIWMHFYDAHDPYDPPSPFKERYASDPYDGEIAYTDTVLGDFLTVLQRHGLYENTVIAVAADHGEAFGEHGEERHGMLLYDETIHVPLLIKLPGEKSAGERVEARVALAEVAPSLLDAAGIPAPKEMQAKSILSLIGEKTPADGKSAPERAIYSETDYAHRAFGWSELQSWRAGKYLFVQAPKRELYDQSSDPDALKNLAPESKAVADTLGNRLSDFRQKTSSAKTEQAKLDPAQAESLRALGYLASDSSSNNTSEKAAIDPKDKIEIANRLHRALVQVEEDHYDDAIAGFREVLKEMPDASTVYLQLGSALIRTNRYEEALPVLRTAAEKNPDSGIVHYELGLALVKTGRWEAALPEMQAAVVCTPTSAQAHFYLAAVNTRLNHVAEASAEYQKALDIDPTLFQANLTYGRMLLRLGHPDAALPKLTQAVKSKPKSAEAHGFLADAYQQLGQTENANRERAQAAKFKTAQPE
jgi:arylsulfatase A-like enzyme/Flp pilus assembly protein TadD